VKTTIAVARNAAYFEGHFPGHPILPGVVELLLVLDALSQESGQAVALRGIAFARLRQRVFPGEHLHLDTRELDNGHIRVELSRSDDPVASAELIPGDPETPGNNPLDQVADPIRSAPPLDALLPHRPPMRFVNSIVGESAQGLDCTASVSAACGLVRDGDAHVLAGVEAAAQTAATWEAVRRWREGGVAAPRIGYLVALRDIVFFAERFPGDRTFNTSIRLEAAAPPLTHYRFGVSLAGAPLARGMIATYLAV
jgi:predicted hotdog family 3-hydroxylacyl-ACP dehydratase